MFSTSARAEADTRDEGPLPFAAMPAADLQPPKGARVIDVGGGRVWRVDGVVFEVIDCPSIELSDIRGFEEAVIELTGGAPGLILADIRKIRWASAEARAYAAGDSMREIVAAHALLVGSPVTRMIGSFFVRVSSPPFPVRLFTASDEATTWLRGRAAPATAS